MTNATSEEFVEKESGAEQEQPEFKLPDDTPQEEESSAAEQPVGQPVEEQPVEEQPVEEQPVEEDPIQESVATTDTAAPPMAVTEAAPETETITTAPEAVTEAAPAPEFILAPTLMQSYCPECGVMLQGTSPTGLKPKLLLHPFGDSALTGEPCRYKGKKFTPPVVRLEMVN